MFSNTFHRDPPTDSLHLYIGIIFVVPLSEFRHKHSKVSHSFRVAYQFHHSVKLRDRSVSGQEEHDEGVSMAPDPNVEEEPRHI